MDKPPELLGIFANFVRSPRDHIAVYVVKSWHLLREPRSNLEILEQRFFDPAALPPTAIDGVARRLSEALEGKRRDATW